MASAFPPEMSGRGTSSLAQLHFCFIIPGKPRLAPGHEQKSKPLVRDVGTANSRLCWCRGAGGTPGECPQSRAQASLLFLGCGHFSKYLNFSDPCPVCHQKDSSSRCCWELLQFPWEPSLGIPNWAEEKTSHRQGHEPFKGIENWQQYPGVWSGETGMKNR